MMISDSGLLFGPPCMSETFLDIMCRCRYWKTQYIYRVAQQ